MYTEDVDGALITTSNDAQIRLHQVAAMRVMILPNVQRLQFGGGRFEGVRQILNELAAGADPKSLGGNKYAHVLDTLSCWS